MTLSTPTSLVKVDKPPSKRQRMDRIGGCHQSDSRTLNESQTSVERPFETSSWKPVTLRPPFLLGIVAITLGFIALLEYLSQRSRMYGGIAFAKDQFSLAVTFAYLYFPTLIAVLYSMLWSWVDLDTKRLEPYFQLSRPEGADRTNSLALNYPFDFVAYAPLKAIRRRHWAVVFAGASTMLIFWGVTPLVSSVFARTTITVEHLSTATQRAALIPLQDQRLAMNTNFIMTAYGIVWLGRAMPEFVTPQGFVEPFQLDKEQASELRNATWTAQTKLYGTSLKCSAADVRNESSSFGYSNGKECNIEALYKPVQEMGSDFGCLYIGYEMDQHADYSLSGMGCSSLANQHLFLAVWGQTMGTDTVTHVSAAFCEPIYWTQAVNATVRVPSMKVTEISPLEPRIPLQDGIFNRTAFEYVIGTGAQAITSRADISETTNIIDQTSKVRKFGILGTVTNMVGFALGLNPTDITNMYDTKILAANFEDAHKLLHALAMRQLMALDVMETQSHLGTINDRISAITIVRPLAVVLEILSGLVLTLILALMTYSYTRPSQLCNNPASLSDVIAMAPDDNSSPDYTYEITSKSSGPRFRLLGGRICVSSPDNASHVPKCNSPRIGSGSCLTKIEAEDRSSLARPVEMSMTVAFIFLLTLLLALTTIITLSILAKKYVGLPVPSGSTVVNQLVLNYLLVIFATFLEPFWLLLNRQLCVLQPFEELRQANAPAFKSLRLTYTSLPPQMNIWNAFRAKHYVLAAVCAIGLSANLLAISLNGLLHIDSSLMAERTNLTRLYEPKFNQHQILVGSADHRYVAKANLSDGVALPPWTTSDTFLVPFEVKTTSRYGTVSGIQASTHGFSIRPQCERAYFNDTALITGEPYGVYVRQRTPSGGSVSCGGFALPSGGQNRSNAALEVLTQLRPIDSSRADPGSYRPAEFLASATSEERLTCGSILVAGFLRANLTMSIDGIKTQNSDQYNYPVIRNINSLSSLWMMCRSDIALAQYEVTVDSSGQVQTYRATGPEIMNPSDAFSNGTSPNSLIKNATFPLVNGRDSGPYWHNDTFVDTWFAYFIKILSNSTMFVDPEQPVPAFEQVVPYVKDLYTRLFAIVLSQNQEWLARAEADSTSHGLLFASSERVLISNQMFVVTVVLLVLNILVAVLYWIRLPKKMLPKLPYTIGSILDMVHASGLRFEARKQGKWDKDWRFGYGRFVGTDGKPHVGIERRPFVQSLDI
ncbi:MAG: hypothetical protein Q9192_005571 [Flavoplaca navasiana]